MPVCDCAAIILAHNGVDFTRHCLNSIVSAGELPREVFVVDNASSDATPDVVAEFHGRFKALGVRCQTWRNEQNKGCSAARNEAWEKATSTYVVLMDNDAAVCTRNWLAKLRTRMDADPMLGILGPKMIYPYRPHPIQCAGVTISPNGRIAFRGRGRPRDTPDLNDFRETHALISATWIMRNDLRESVGMLDELFHPVQYEDLDLCLRAAQAGYRVAYEPAVEMYHFEGITTASVGQEEYRRNIARNSLKFRERWMAVIRTYRDELPAEDFRWRQRAELGLTPELDLSYD